MRRQRARVNPIVLSTTLVVACWLLGDRTPTWGQTPSTHPTTQPSDPFAAAIPADLVDAAQVRIWFNNLADSDPEVRSEALVALMGLRPDQLVTLEKIVRESRPLAPSQESVLRRLVSHVYLAGMNYVGDQASGFLGVHLKEAISFGDNASTSPGVYIFDCIPGFIGSRMLRDGDLILGIRERPDAPIGNSAMFPTIVSGLRAGTLIHFQVLRQGQVIWVPLTLAARPMVDEIGITRFVADRQMWAEQFWEAHFAPLLAPTTKVTTDAR